MNIAGRSFLCLMILFTCAYADMPDDQTRVVSKVITSGVSFNQQISSSNINNSITALTNGGQFVITKSGRYFLSTDVVANPNVTVPVVYIATSDVVIDLGGKTLSLTASSQSKGSVGIQVAPGLRNITISNGTISGANTVGAGNAFVQGIVVGDPAGLNNAQCANITLDSVIVTSCMRSGIGLYNCQNVMVNDVAIQGIFDNGLTLVPTATVQKTCMTMYNCTDSQIINSDFNGARLGSGFNPGHLVVGLDLQNCRNIMCKDITAAENAASTAGSAIGIRVSGTISSKFDNIRAVGNRSNSVNANDYFVAGLLLESNSVTGVSSTGNYFSNCAFSDNIGSSLSVTTSVYGLRATASCNNNTLVNCIASNNNGVLGCGFAFYASRSNTLKDCIANGNYSVANVTYAQACGFMSEFGTGNSFIRCEARGNTVSGVTVGGSGGQSSAIAQSSQFVNPSAFGFQVRSENYSALRECLSASNYGSQSLQHLAYGVAFTGSCYACLVTFSEMDSNRAMYNYGFKDFAPESTTLLRGNVSFAHGQCFVGGQSSLIDVGTSNYMVTYTDPNGTMDVQNLIKEADIANMNAFEAGSSRWFNFSILAGAISSMTLDI